MQNFYTDFAKHLDTALDGEKVRETVGRNCPTCDHELVYKFSK